tara:strand:+ start:879 stop:1133 length:255 start_codon:yes stop_codon:yes gene_type:complete
MAISKTQSEFQCCKWIWHLYLCELNYNQKAINPLEVVPESFWPEVTDLLKEAKYIGESKDFYLKESYKYADYLGKGGKPYPKIK